MNNLYKSSLAQPSDGVVIKDVYSDTLEEDLRQISELIEDYPYVAMVLLSLYF
jgi:hypothetical protein